MQDIVPLVTGNLKEKMDFDIKKGIQILKRTPRVLSVFLENLDDDWIRNNEGKNTWSPYDILGHLIHCEKTDWIPRTQIILSENNDKHFEPFDRFAQFKDSKGKTLKELLLVFSELRKKNIEKLESLILDDVSLTLKGIHPEFGEVSLKELLATWVTHDLSHINQISRVMAKQYKDEVGPWVNYIGLLER